MSCVEYLLTHDARPTVFLPGGITLLHSAAFKGSAEIMRFLLQVVKDYKNYVNSVSDKSEGGMTPLHVSCKEGHVECVDLLIQYGAEIMTRTTEEKIYHGSTPLHLVAKYGFLKVAEVLIKKDREVLEQKNSDSWKPLHVAARFGKTECVRLFLKCGGNLSSEVKLAGYRKTALDLIVSFIPQPVEFLREVFDSFIEKNGHPLTHKDCVVTFKFDLLSPQREDDQKQLCVLDAVINSSNITIQEVLLIHPLTEMFLYLKRKQLRIFSYLIFGLYCALTISATGAAMSICTKESHYKIIDLSFYLITWLISIIILVTLVSNYLFHDIL